MVGAFEIDVLGVTAAGAPEIEGGEVGAEVADVLGVTAVKVTFLTTLYEVSVK